jgi:hypothetical protein
LVDLIEDRSTLDKILAIVEHQYGDPYKGICSGERCRGVRKQKPFPVSNDILRMFKLTATLRT